MKKPIAWPQKEFLLQELIGLNPDFDTLTLHFLVNRRLSDGSLFRTSKPGEYCTKASETVVKQKNSATISPPVSQLRGVKKPVKGRSGRRELASATA
jgi:hypothetical protein